MILLLDAVENERLSAETLLTEAVRCLLNLKQARQQRVASLLDDLKYTEGGLPLSSEDIVNLIRQHLALPRAARLPVLAVAAAYQSASIHLHERVLPLQAHTAADERTGAIGDVEIALVDDEQIITVYEMKLKPITKDDIDRALQKIKNSAAHIDNYIFITTEETDERVIEYAVNLYRDTGGIEFVVLDCISFLRHFLHLFHRLRITFLNTYQEFLLNEPDSAVRESLKEAFLAMRRAAESSYSDR